MRLIDAHALKKKLRTNEGAEMLRHSVVALFAIDDILDAQPTVDAVPVVHGRWKNIAGGMVMLGDCSECNERQPIFANYCRNCGAKMEVDENG